MNAGDLFDLEGYNLPSWWFNNYGTEKSATALAEIASAGANAVTIVPTYYISNAKAHDFHATLQTEPLKNIARAIDQAHGKGLQVVLKPHVDALSGEWRGYFDPSDPDRWFQGYVNTVITPLARLAEEKKVEVFCIGTEFSHIMRQSYAADRWDSVISAVRGVYHGNITYAANWDEYDDIPDAFWRSVDFIGIDAYQPVATTFNPSPAEIKQAWLAILEKYQEKAMALGRPVLLTEMGYPDIDGAGMQPWDSSGSPDWAEQRILFDGFFQAIHAFDNKADWLRGFLIWNWVVDPKHDRNHAYWPHGKPAEMVIEKALKGVDVPTPPVARGTAEADRMFGSFASDRILGLAGNDTMHGLGNADSLDGGAGNDSLFGGVGKDRLLGGIGNDQLIGGSGADSLDGAAGNDSLDGGADNDTLNGGSDADTMVGGTGSDRYSVDHPGDRVSESSANANTGGRDTVYSHLPAYTLPANVENLRLLSTSTAKAVGNELDNTLYAGGGNNVLDGRGGSDTVSYAYATSGVNVSLARSSAQATGGSGSDTLLRIENLGGGSQHDQLTGNGTANRLDGAAGNDTVSGGAGNDLLLGGLGNDRLSGGSGKDVFRFDTRPNASGNLDRITDFNVRDDTLQLENAVFTSLTAVGALAQGSLRAGNGGPSARDANDYLIYNRTTGALYYDADGNGSGAAAVHFATLPSGLALSNLDFLVT